MSKGLGIARMLHQAGHNVIGADFEPHGIPVSGRFSKSINKFYALSKPSEVRGSTHYVEDLLRIVRREEVDLWISCSGVASAVDDGQVMEVIERMTDCKAIQFNVDTTATLHEKHSFVQHTLRIGLPAPETYDVTSRDAVHKILNHKRSKKFIMKSVGMDDAYRGNMTLLPRRTVSETYGHISNMPISNTKPWILQQFIPGEEYCTHALVIKGQVKAFVACPSSELLMHYEALPFTSSLSQAMYKFTSEYAARSEGAITGHLSFDFLVEERATETGLEKRIYPIECNPRAHTAVVLFNGLGVDMAKAYLIALQSDMNGSANGSSTNPLTPLRPAKYYWIGHDIVEFVVFPLLQLLMLKISLGDFTRGCYTFLEHLFLWKDGTFEMWDPLPWWWLYHIYWPGQFLSCILQRKKWSRINVSTIKIFQC